MTFNGRFCFLILAVGLLLATFSSAALAAGDTVAITIEKWTSSFGSLSGSTGPMVVDEDDAGVFTFSGFYVPTFDADPFSGALDVNVIFALDSTSTDSALLNSNVDIKKDSTSDTSQYWIKVFVEKKAQPPVVAPLMLVVLATRIPVAAHFRPPLLILRRPPVSPTGLCRA